MPLFNPVTPAEIGGLAAVNNLSDVASISKWCLQWAALGN